MKNGGLTDKKMSKKRNIYKKFFKKRKISIEYSEKTCTLLFNASRMSLGKKCICRFWQIQNESKDMSLCQGRKRDLSNPSGRKRMGLSRKVSNGIELLVARKEPDFCVGTQGRITFPGVHARRGSCLTIVYCEGVSFLCKRKKVAFQTEF